MKGTAATGQAKNKAKGSPDSSSNVGVKRRLKLWLAFVAIFMGWALLTLFDQYESQAKTEQRLAEIELKIEETSQVSNELQQRIDRLNDDEYISEIARKEFGLAMPGEKPIQITEESD